MTDGLEVKVEAWLGGFRLDAAFKAPPRGVTALFGASGAGKSSLLAAVAGALRPDRGRIAFGSEVLFDSEARIDRPMEKRAVGWVFQDSRLFPHLTVAANLAYGLKRSRGRPQRFGLDEVVAVLGIEGLLDRLPRALSGGERQRVAVGRALLSQPRLMLMDEPFAGLDAPRRAEIAPFLDRLKAAFDLPILHVTHSLAEVVRLADRMVVLERGAVLAQGAVAEVMARADLPLLAERADAAAAVETTVAGHDAARGLSRLSSGDAALLVPTLDAPVGAAVRALVLARDVLVAVEPPRGLSARNILPVIIERLETRGDGVVLAVLAVTAAPGVRLLSALTRDAVSALGLSPGRPAWAVIKSVAVEGRQGGLLAALDE